MSVSGRGTDERRWPWRGAASGSERRKGGSLGPPWARESPGPVPGGAPCSFARASEAAGGTAGGTAGGFAGGGTLAPSLFAIQVHAEAREPLIRVRARAAGFGGPLLIMQSTGGVMPPDYVARRAVSVLASTVFFLHNARDAWNARADLEVGAARVLVVP